MAYNPIRQYTQGDTDATIDGLAILMEGAGDTLLPVQGTIADGLLVNLGANNDVTVTGSVSATQSGTWILGANSGIDIGDVTINNAAGASAVNIQDGGNVITVDGTVSVTGVATEATLASLLTSSQLIDDTVGTSSGSLNKFIILGAHEKSTAELHELHIGVFGGGDVHALKTLIVDGSGNHITSFGGGTQYTEADTDATITGTALMMEDAADTLVPAQGTVTDGLLVNLGANNDVTVTGTVTANQGGTWNINNISGTVSLPTGAATAANQSTAITALQLLDDTVFVAGTDTYTEATSKGNLILAVRRDADTTLVNTTNEFGPLQMDVNGRLKVEVFSGETLPVSLTSTTITGTVAVTQSGTWDEVGINDSGNSITVDAPVGTPVNTQLGNGTLTVGVIDETGAAAVDALAVGGGTAHDAVDSGNPVKIGGVAVSGSASPTSVASGDRVRLIANQHGIPYNIGGHPNIITREYDFGTAAQTDVNLAAAAVAADERIYVTRFEAMCDNANTVAVSVRAGFGTASVPTASATGVSGMIASHPGLAAGSGFVSGNGSGIIAVGGAGEEPRLTSSAATTGNLHVIISYFLIDETP